MGTRIAFRTDRKSKYTTTQRTIKMVFKNLISAPLSDIYYNTIHTFPTLN